MRPRRFRDAVLTAWSRRIDPYLRGMPREVWIGVTTALLLHFVQVLWLDHTDLAKTLRVASRDYIHRSLMGKSDREPLPVQVVDISRLSPAPVPGHPDRPPATPRREMRDLIERIAAHQPLAIGVDVDFSPDSAGFIDPTGDRSLLLRCSEIAQGAAGLPAPVPVYLGILRSAGGTTEEWLGDAAFSRLAASIILPRLESRPLLEWTRFEDTRCPSMASRLARHWPGPKRARPRWIQWLVAPVQSLEPHEAEGFALSVVHADYSPIERLEAESVAIGSSAEVPANADRLRGRIVLLGDVENAIDRFPVPGRLSAVPGVFLHACGARTLARAPLYVPAEPFGRLLLNLGVGLAIVLVTARLRESARRRWGLRLHGERFQRLFEVGYAVMLFIAAVWLTRWTRLVWDDFMIAIPVLTVTPWVERNVSRRLVDLSARRRAEAP